MNCISALQFVVLLLLRLNPSFSSDNGGQNHVNLPRNFAVVSYLPEWRYEGANWDVIAEHSSHIVLFSLEPGINGEILALDRLPRPKLLKEAVDAAAKYGSKILICFGGNGRSSGFSRMVRSKSARKRFVERAVEMVELHALDGIDYNWEYPGYSFGRGYHAEDEVIKDYNGLASLIQETKAALAYRRGIVTMSYYPDGRQEQLLATSGITSHVDLMHAMAYDAGGEHSTLQLAEKAIRQGAQHFPSNKMTLGVPFYARHTRTGNWVSYEDIIQKMHGHTQFDPSIDRLDDLYFNGVNTIRAKTKLAIESKTTGGVMIWEAGQDCRLAEVKHGSDIHIQTCPGREYSLFNAIHDELRETGREEL